MLESINDLPAHIFFVHAPVVLVPLVAIASLVIAMRPRWRITYAPLLALASLVAFVCTFLAKESGEAFDELLEGQVDVTRHEDLADQTTLLVFVLLLLTVCRRNHQPTQAQVDHRNRRRHPRRSRLASRLRPAGSIDYFHCHERGHRRRFGTRHAVDGADRR